MKIRAYGKGELAQLYCPNITTAAARKKLMQWINLYPNLMDDLHRAGLSGQGDRRIGHRRVLRRRRALRDGLSAIRRCDCAGVWRIKKEERLLRQSSGADASLHSL